MEINTELAKTTKLLADSTLLAPVSGKIENLLVNTVGGYVEAGATVMTIVPTDGDVELEAVFENRDIGFLKVGQKAFLKFDAFPSERLES